MAQRGMWHLMERSVRDARRGETKESEHVVRECKTWTEEESWSSCNQVNEQVTANNQVSGRGPNVDLQENVEGSPRIREQCSCSGKVRLGF